ncbi:hypothetical protein M0R45_008560 [Rubus argutus]|uniref:Uncharacterized protein n=1 Tax=Rubus argutus TaxID=59490 RepID=A0AAW1Y5B3_RUBAR
MQFRTEHGDSEVHGSRVTAQFRGERERAAAKAMRRARRAGLATEQNRHTADWAQQNWADWCRDFVDWARLCVQRWRKARWQL